MFRALQTGNRLDRRNQVGVVREDDGHVRKFADDVLNSGERQLHVDSLLDWRLVGVSRIAQWPQAWNHQIGILFHPGCGLAAIGSVAHWISS